MTNRLFTDKIPLLQTWKKRRVISTFVLILLFREKLVWCEAFGTRSNGSLQSSVPEPFSKELRQPRYRQRS